ncbi:transcriptional attenuator, LytR family [Thermosyntropha lipolytica DSM 11003]|uniref:Transcriptional attenuator, LytR family n=1 Tax=Thermosyntropha lipolytica DSM 11003 TaxID=1123382 RepID=A0A1M5JW73_9FIRM|nr:LCP family protein [Thermosyntropha lipolytica]SHG44827.1 transcriptional attenuator, LytR family [Thermosyntropha lipolytica DSM 11003]
MAKIKGYLILMLAAGLVFGSFFSLGAFITRWLPLAGIEENTDADNNYEKGERVNILVLGIDKRPGETNARSDTVMLVSIDPALSKAVVLSIPRDTRVEIKGSPVDKICSANMVGGPSYAVRTVEKLLDIDIDYYVAVDFNGFKEIIDTLGGVTIEVPQRMYKPSEDIDLYPGVQRLNGRQALAFVRYRGYIQGDIARTQMQQQFIKALADEVLKPKTLAKLPTLVKQVNKYVETDMGVRDMLKLASWAPRFSADSIITQTLPGYFYDEYNSHGVMVASYWIADKRQISGILDKLFAGETMAVVSEPPAGFYTSGGKVAKRVEEEKISSERSRLPSPGHSTPGAIEQGSYTPSFTGSDGYL